MMQGSTRLFLSIALIAACLKILLIPAYKSTDFEVHRNWLAITHSLPLSRWYVDETSQWTLDYPPLFAWLEKSLSVVAEKVDPQMLVVDNLNYASHSTVIFQRLSVVVMDATLLYAIWCWVKHLTVKSKEADAKACCANPHVMISVFSLINAGLILVDNIHFQYNGFLFGILLLSILRIIQQRYIEGSVWFAVLLNLKHIYLYIAPAYGVFLLRVYCFSDDKSRVFRLTSFKLTRFLCLAFAVGIVFLLSFGPFIYLHQMPQVLSRLFPFKRGLCHAYWAPNFWALYNMADKILTVAAVKSGLASGTGARAAAMTGGLVQEFEHTFLVSVKPVHTLILTMLSIVPALVRVWVRPYSAKSFIRCIVMCAFGSFMFGWHVHEKALLLVTVPLICLAVTDRKDAELFVLLSMTEYYSLTPLIFTSAEAVVKYGLLLAHAVYLFHSSRILWDNETRKKSFSFPLLNVIESCYVAGLFAVEIYCSVIHQVLGLNNSLPFLPLLLISVYCAIGVTYCWAKAYYYYLTSE